MKLIKKTALFFVTLFFLGNVTAQVSGYMGKRFILKFDTYSIPYIPMEEPKDFPINHFPFRKYYGFDYVVGRNSMFGLAFGKCNTQFNHEGNFGHINNTGFSISYTTYLSNHGIAPIGKFYQFRLNYFQSDYNVRVMDYFGIGQDRKVGEVQNFILAMVVGNSGIIFDRFIYSYGFQFGYRLGTLIGFMTDSDLIYSDIESSVKTRNLINEFWGVHAGIGIIL